MCQFKLTKPCNNCPFRKGAGRNFQLGAGQVQAFLDSPSFQCHKTVDYDHYEDPRKRQGEKPQQCAGLMALLANEGRANQIMQVGERLGYFDPARLDRSEVYATAAEAMADHS